MSSNAVKLGGSAGAAASHPAPSSAGYDQSARDEHLVKHYCMPAKQFKVDDGRAAHLKAMVAASPKPGTSIIPVIGRGLSEAQLRQMRENMHAQNRHTNGVNGKTPPKKNSQRAAFDQHKAWITTVLHHSEPDKSNVVDRETAARAYAGVEQAKLARHLDIIGESAPRIYVQTFPADCSGTVEEYFQRVLFGRKPSSDTEHIVIVLDATQYGLHKYALTRGTKDVQAREHNPQRRHALKELCAECSGRPHNAQAREEVMQWCQFDFVLRLLLPSTGTERRHLEGQLENRGTLLGLAWAMYQKTRAGGRDLTQGFKDVALDAAHKAVATMARQQQDMAGEAEFDDAHAPQKQKGPSCPRCGDLYRWSAPCPNLLCYR